MAALSGRRVVRRTEESIWMDASDSVFTGEPETTVHCRPVRIQERRLRRDMDNKSLPISPATKRSTEKPSGGPIDLDQSGAEIYPLISALAVSPLDGNLIWAGSDDGLAHITTDGGKKLAESDAARIAGLAWISCIEPSHTDKQTAYLTARRYMLGRFPAVHLRDNRFGPALDRDHDRPAGQRICLRSSAGP